MPTDEFNYDDLEPDDFESVDPDFESLYDPPDQPWDDEYPSEPPDHFFEYLESSKEYQEEAEEVCEEIQNRRKKLIVSEFITNGLIRHPESYFIQAVIPLALEKTAGDAMEFIESLSSSIREHLPELAAPDNFFLCEHIDQLIPAGHVIARFGSRYGHDINFASHFSFILEAILLSGITADELGHSWLIEGFESSPHGLMLQIPTTPNTETHSNYHRLNREVENIQKRINEENETKQEILKLVSKLEQEQLQIPEKIESLKIELEEIQTALRLAKKFKRGYIDFGDLANDKASSIDHLRRQDNKNLIELNRLREKSSWHDKAAKKLTGQKETLEAQITEIEKDGQNP